MHPPFRNNQDAGPIGRFIIGAFGFVFAGIGVSVIIFVWSQSFGGFGSPPLIFRVFASFIALAFIAMGGGTLVAAVLGRPGFGPVANSPIPTPADSTAPRPPVTSSLGYTCPHCGATLADKPDVSPLGDVKCTFCKQWFNIHRT